MFRSIPLSVILLLAGAACAQANETGQEDFPTLARVEYVLGCMKQRGGENYDTLYGCVCAIDYIRSQFDYDEYSEAVTYQMLKSTPGEKGGVFRDPDQADALRTKLDKIDDTIQQRCFMGHNQTARTQ